MESKNMMLRTLTRTITLLSALIPMLASYAAEIELSCAGAIYSLRSGEKLASNDFSMYLDIDARQVRGRNYKTGRSETFSILRTTGSKIEWMDDESNYMSLDRESLRLTGVGEKISWRGTCSRGKL